MLLTVDEAAAVLRCSRDRVFDLINAGEITAAPRTGRKRCVTKASVEAFALSGVKRGPRARRRAAREWEPVTMGDLR